MKVVRAFVGFFANKTIHEVSERLRKEVGYGITGKWVEPQNLHITLQFLGDITEKQAIDVIKNLQELAKRNIPFKLTYKGLGVFPDIKRARVLWIGVSRGSEKLKNLAKSVERMNAKVGIPPSSKSFVPHLTICRIKRYDRKVLTHLLNKYRTIEFGEEEVKSIALISSTLTAVGPIYTVVEEFHLGV